MRRIDYIVIHCTATSQNTKLESILRYFREVLGWKVPGYHHIIDKKGLIYDTLPIEKIANGVKGFNANSIHISYIGGLKTDDRTQEQKGAILYLLRKYKKAYPNAKIQGHRDFPNVKKLCPQFNAKTEYQNLDI